MFERYYRELLNFLSRSVRNRELAADLTQESYARVLAAQRGGPVQDPRALLYATARHLVIDHHRRSTVRGVPTDGSPPDPDTLVDTPGPSAYEPDTILDGRQRLRALEQVLTALPARPREAFVLYKLDGLSRAEVAERMGISVRTVETHLEVAVRACVEHMQALDKGREP